MSIGHSKQLSVPHKGFDRKALRKYQNLPLFLRWDDCHPQRFLYPY